MLRKFSQFWLKRYGWTIEGMFEPVPAKFIMIVVPHTASMDFPLAIMVRAVLGMQSTKYLGKSQLFRFPFGFIFRALGGYPVFRTRDNNLVDAVTEIFNNHDKFSIALSPEGTRSKVKRLKTGFYHIARKANIPIIPVGFDYSTRTIVVNPPFYTSNNFENDFRLLFGLFTEIKGKYPELGIDSSIVESTLKGQKI